MKNIRVNKKKEMKLKNTINAKKLPKIITDSKMA